MHSRICINGMSTRHFALAQDMDLYGELGVHSATVPYRKIEEAGALAAALLADAGVRPALIGGGPATPFLGGLDAVRAAIDATAQLGSPAFYSISGAPDGLVSTDDAFIMLVDALGPVVDYARSRGVRIAIENNSVATREHGFIHTLADSADLADAADVDICLELQNCWYERLLPTLFRANARRFVMVQISDFVVSEDLRLNRRVPGDGSIPLEWLVGQLLDAGYEGLFDIEILGPAIEREGYREAIVRSVDWLTERLKRWGV